MKQAFATVLLLGGVLLFGCSGVTKQIRAESIDRRTDVFREVSIDADPPPGSVILTIKAEVKTHHEGYYLLESKKSLQGKPHYPLLLNIDGQHVMWEMPGQRDDSPVYDDKGQKTPESGKGMKYAVERKLQLVPGRHRVVVALPGDNYIKEFQISLPGDKPNMLEFKPVYEPGGIGRQPNFMYGVRNFDVFLNGGEVP